MEEVEAIKGLRSRRASYRADGIQLLTTLLTQSSSLPAQIYLLNSFMRALREVSQSHHGHGHFEPHLDLTTRASIPWLYQFQARHSKDTTFPHVHYQNGVEGCSLECAAHLAEAFLQFLKVSVEILRSIWPFLEGSNQGPTSQNLDLGTGSAGAASIDRANERQAERQLRQQLALTVLQVGSC